MRWSATAALLLPGCGDDGAATADNPATTQTKAKTDASAKVGTAVASCPRQVDAFVNSLDTLRRQLAIGLSYEQYAAKVKALRESYGRLPIDRLAIGCLSRDRHPRRGGAQRVHRRRQRLGRVPRRRLLHHRAIEPVLQRKWRLASRHLSEAR